MEYVNILSMVYDTDKTTTKNLAPLFNSVPTNYFVDSSILSDTPITNKIDDSSFISVYKDEDLDCVKLEYYYNGNGSIKSCKNKIEIEFVSHLLEDLPLMEVDHPTSIADDICCSQLCMIVTGFELTRDPIDFNQVHSKQKYCNGYFLRKNKNNEYILESQINNLNPVVKNNYTFNSMSLFNKPSYSFQRQLSSTPSYVDEIKSAKEIDNIEELKNLYDFEDVDYNEDDLDEYYNDDDYHI